ncbi:carboxypeptidase-like regulatory domain-containing protein [Hymenobacter sp. BRD128]|uniref:carboxypeptidase-like regulatory domain-containing protein n=1 Tax=Hymenobacter sp. BRD128 TaxID=2675878 RepID=UPI0015667CED|nr:carboxypeptidase-like regulatory domain-containing protein [Hymenobacter sp. BRD128]QKG56399.1 carboxypeptidase-like regulatory domain-containing protein [Hymenobacter sp. BRD128]
MLLPLAAAAQTASGRVVASNTGAPLPQATVRLAGQAAGTSTDEAGRFSLPLPGAAPTARLIISHLGYQSQSLAVDQLGPVVALEELAYQIGEVVVTYESIRKLLLKKWKIDEGSIVAVADNVIADVQKTDSLRAKKLLQNPSSLRAVLKLARLVFLDDGTVKVKMLLFGSKAKWQLDEAQRTLHVVGLKGNDEPITIVELTANRLVIHDAANPNRQDEVYIPAD